MHVVVKIFACHPLGPLRQHQGDGHETAEQEKDLQAVLEARADDHISVLLDGAGTQEKVGLCLQQRGGAQEVVLVIPEVDGGPEPEWRVAAC